LSLETTVRKIADVTWRSNSFQTRAAATGKARSPTVDNRVRRTINDYDDDDYDEDDELRNHRGFLSVGPISWLKTV